MGLILYGIKNCDTVRKARTWLGANGLEYRFHDYKTAGIDAQTLERWANAVGWEALLNRSGTTFRQLPAQRKSDLTQAKAIGLMLEQPSMIKRPVLDDGQRVIVGYSVERYLAV